MKKIIHLILKTASILAILFFCVFQISNEDHKSSYPFKYQQIFASTDTTLSIGFGKESIVPHKPVKMVGYGLRDPFEGVHDSLFTRCVVFKSSNQLVAILSLDLILISPEISWRIRNELKKNSVKNVIFSASHSHSSIGGFGDKLLNKIILGGRDEEVIDYLVGQSVNCVQKAIQSIERIKNITYETRVFSDLKHRITKERDIEDFLRDMRITTVNGKSIDILSSNAHPTIINHSRKLLSNDYPGQLCMQKKSDFTIFLAGTMGSCAPVIHHGKDDFDRAANFAKLQLDAKMVSQQKIKTNGISYGEALIQTSKLGMQISSNIKLRNWLFALLMGESKAEIQTLKIGNFLMVSLPAELSLEFYPVLNEIAQKKGLILMLTTFNGQYLGYVFPSGKFAKSHMETREMNWLGKYGGDNFNEVIQKIIEKQ